MHLGIELTEQIHTVARAVEAQVPWPGALGHVHRGLLGRRQRAGIRIEAVAVQLPTAQRGRKYPLIRRVHLRAMGVRSGGVH